MVRGTRESVLTALLILFGLVPPVSAEPERPILFQHLLLEDGLSQSSVVCVLQDRRGFIWMGTQDGLNRYDGRQIIQYKADIDDPESLSDPNVTCLAEDARGRLWVGTEGGGFNCFDPETGRFQVYRHDPSQPRSTEHYDVRSIVADEAGIVWVGTMGDGLLRFDPGTGTLVAYRHNAGDPDGLPSDDLNCLALDSTGAIWIGSDGGLTRFDPAAPAMRTFAPPVVRSAGAASVNVLSLCPGRGGRWWTGTETALYDFDPAGGSFAPLDLSTPDNPERRVSPINVLFEDGTGRLWAGTDHLGLYILDPRRGTVGLYGHDPLDDYSLSDNEVKAITADRTGVIWIGTSNGASRLDTQAKQFHHVAHRPQDPASLSDDCVWSLIEDRRGDVWVVTESGVNLYHPDTGRVDRLDADANDPHRPGYDSFISLHEDALGGIWMGARDGYLNRYDPQTGLYRRFGADPDSPTEPDDNRVFSMAGDAQGNLWLGTWTGLERYDAAAGTFRSFAHDADDPASLPEGSVRDLLLDHAGNLWLSLWGSGVARYAPDTGNWDLYRHLADDPTTPSSNVVLCIFEDRLGRIWLGTTTGLNLLDPHDGHTRRYTERNGLPNNTIYCIEEDSSGNLWLSTNYGLARFDPASGAIHTYLKHDGIQNNEFNMGASYTGRSGRMYFGGIGGFNVFYPDSIRHNPYVPAVVLTDFRIFNRPVVVGPDERGRVILDRNITSAETIHLTHADHVVSFEFAVLHYASPQKNRFAYRLEGFEDDWNFVGGRNHATYTNLPPGSYTFRVRGANNDGVWNEEGASVALVVKPPFYLTPWFLGAAIALLAGIVYGAHRYRMRLLDVKNRVLERRVAVRTRDLTQANAQLQLEITARKSIEAELRDAKNSAEAATLAKSEFLANMSHEIRTPMNGVLGMTEILLDTDLSTDQRDYGEMIQTSARNLLVVINDILDFSKIEAGKLELEAIDFDLCQVVDGVVDTLSQAARDKGLHLRCHIDRDVPRYLVGDPARVRQVLINLANNAVKFTRAGTVEITTRLLESDAGEAKLLFSVRDTGVGIPADRLDRIFGSFTQVDASITRQFGGTGLGLAIVKQLVDLMGGEVGVESVEQDGTVFWFTLRLPCSPLLQPPRHGGRVAVIYDVPQVLEDAGKQLAYLGIAAQGTPPDRAPALLAEAARSGRPFTAVLVGSRLGLEPVRGLIEEIRRAGRPAPPDLVLIGEFGALGDQAELEAAGLCSSLAVPLHHGRLETLLGVLHKEPTRPRVPELRPDREMVKRETHGVPEPRRAAADPVAPEQGQRPRLLLAEDNPINQRVACLILEKAGYAVDVASTGRQVLAAVAQRRYAAILMDVQMPEMDGLEATRILRGPESPALDPAVPIVALTAHAMDQDRERSLAAGMDDHVSKPIDSAEITEVLSRLIHSSHCPA